MARDFFEEMGRAVADAFEDVGKKTGEIVEVQKLKGKAYSLRKETEVLYTQLGRQVFQKYEQSEPIDPELVDLCDDIMVCKNRWKELEEEISQIKGVRSCSNCGASVEKSDVFCKHCGAPMSN